jgi:hypothetical protein
MLGGIQSGLGSYHARSGSLGGEIGAALVVVRVGSWKADVGGREKAEGGWEGVDAEREG